MPLSRVVFETGTDSGLVEDQKLQNCRSVNNPLNPNKKPIFPAADFVTKEICSFQDRSDGRHIES